VIVRVLHDRQYDVPNEALARLEKLDAELDLALQTGDADAFASALASLVTEVRTAGKALPDDEIVPSERTVPAPGSSLEEVRELLASGEAETTSAPDQPDAERVGG
jgi:ABC-type amino acid transport substrate-binding protein